MSLSKLPRELILTVADTLPTASLSRLLRTCHSLYQFLGPALITRITTEQLAGAILSSGITHHHLPTVQLGLAHNAAWHTESENGDCYSAFEHACDSGLIDIVAILISHYGPTIFTKYRRPDQTYCHNNPLETAIRSNDLALTTVLLEHGFPANRAVWDRYPNSDETPLDFTAKYGSAKIAEALIKHGADASGAGRSLSYAVENARWDVAKVLLREGVSVWAPAFKWTDRFPLGSRSPDEIEAWVKGGMQYIDLCYDQQDRSDRAKYK